MTAKARADQFAHRVNAAADLLDQGLAVPETARQLARRYEVSERQARRYVEQAQQGGRVAVPSPKEVFTVKLPTDLIQRLRRYTRRHHETLSAVVAEALEEFLNRRRARRHGG